MSDQQSSPRELLPCPFCGFTPRIDDEDFCYPETRDKKVWGANCPQPAGGCGASVLAGSREDAVSAWNTRSTPSEIAHTQSGHENAQDGHGSARSATGETWRPMMSAPLDGTEIEILFQHFDYWTCLKLSGKEQADKEYRAAQRAHWIDHKGGGWTWHGMAGSPVGWRPISNPDRTADQCGIDQ